MSEGRASETIGSGEGSSVSALPLRIRDLGRVAYEKALTIQEEVLAAKVAGDPVDDLLIVEHDPVYTLGRGANEEDLLGAPQRFGVPVFRVGRGGGVTFHGPGQLVAYPITRLSRGGRDVERYVRRLEQVVVQTCQHFDLRATARPELTGVWVGECKIASIGIGVRRWITYHGLALNVSTDLAYFDGVVPCRMPSVRMTSLEKILGRQVSMGEVAAALIDCFTKVMGYGSFERQPAG